MTPPRCAAVILAAGLSTRLGRFKPLLPLGDGTVAGHLIATFRDVGVDVFLVTGHRADELRAGLASHPVTFVANPAYRHGMLSSIQAGLRALPDRYRAAFIAPVDVPLVGPATLRTLVAVSAESPGRIVIPAFNGKKGHPPLVPAALFPVIAGEPRDSNLRNVLHRYGEITEVVPVPDAGIVFDIDRSGDYDELLARYAAVISGREEYEPGE